MISCYDQFVVLWVFCWTEVLEFCAVYSLPLEFSSFGL